jgi:Ras-related protein Rab-7A
MEEYCLIVVGNKTDLVPSSEEGAISEVTALQFIDELVPPSESLSSSPVTPADEGEGAWIPSHPPPRVPSGSDENDDDGNLDSGTTDSEDFIRVDETRPPVFHLTTPDADHDISVADEEDPTTPTIMIPPRTPSIDLHAHHPKRSFKSRSRFSLTPSVTVSSIQTDFASFHTPASSFSDGLEPYESAVSSPLSHSRSPSSSPPLYAHRTYRSLSTSTVSTSTAPTITPARYAAVRQSTHRMVPSRPPRGPKLFFTSAKTGAGVSDVFDYVARRVVMRWEWEEDRVGSPTLVRNPSAVHLGDATTGKKRAFRPACCSQ